MQIIGQSYFFIVFLFLFNYAYAQPTAPISEFIKIDQFGYLPDAEKVAVISNPQSGYNGSQYFYPASNLEVREWSTGNTVFTGAPQAWKSGATHTQSGDKGWWFDFSSVNTPGSYYIYDADNDVHSGRFEIDATVYHDVLKAAGRMFFYNRCNHAKQSPYAATGWTDNAAFSKPLQDVNCRSVFAQSDPSSEKDMSGGWFDAGDFNKYITTADRTVHDLLLAYEDNPTIFQDDWNIPESGNGIPDLLDEIKWEIDWMRRMNNADGSTHLKVGSLNHAANVQVPPSANSAPRYYGATCTSASISVAGVFAHAALVYQNIPSLTAYAQDLEARAITTWAYVLPFINNNQLQTNCDKGEIIYGDLDNSVTQQKNKAFTAAVYLYALTGNSSYNQYIINNASDLEQLSTTYWGPYEIALNDALFLYTSLPGANSSVVNDILNSLNITTSYNSLKFYGMDDTDLYRAHLPDGNYHWSSNAPKSSVGLMNLALVKYDVNQTEHTDYNIRALETVHYFHGVNPLGIIYLTNMYSLGAERSANEMYHQWFKTGSVWDNAITSLYGPPPGYVNGGPNKNFTLSTIAPPANQPIQKSYLDYNDDYPSNSWEISEPCIFNQAAYFRLLASVIPANSCPAAGTPCNDNDPTTVNDVTDGACGCAGVQGDCELLSNPTFETSLTDWDNWGSTKTLVNGTVYIDGITEGNPWNAAFYQENIPLWQGKNYQIAIRAKADSTRSLMVKLGLGVSPYSVYTFQPLNLSDQMSTSTLNFTMTNATDLVANLELQIGESGVPITIESISLVEVACTNCPALGTPCDDNNPATSNDLEDGNCTCIGTSCLELEIYAFLEGAYDQQANTMTTTLNTTRNLLPGMQNNQVTGHPYSTLPWSYNGTEGSGWNASNYNTDVVDWVLISLRTDPTKGSQVFQAAALLNKDGSVTMVDECRLDNLSGTAFYVVLEHRNHMGVMSANPISINNDKLLMDFRLGPGYGGVGNGQKELTTGVWGLVTGDGDQLSDVASYDVNAMDKLLLIQEFGLFNQYRASDFNMDGDVNGNDKIFWHYNNGLFSTVPR